MTEAQVIDLTNMSESDSDSQTQSSEGFDEPLDDISQTQLQVAIAVTPEERLREIIAHLVVDNPTVGRALFRELVTFQGPNATGDTSGEESDQDPPEVQLQQHPSNLVPRWNECAKCEKEFDAGTPRVHGECRHHTGDLEVNEEAFPDEPDGGDGDNSFNREEFPEGFDWNCCGKDGRSEGCEKDTHTPAGPRKKKRKFE